MSLFPRAHLFALGGLVAGCTTILGIDENYAPAQQAVSGGTGGTGARGGTSSTTGGSAGSGGSQGATGGLGGVGGGSGGGSGGTGTLTCTSPQKVCTFETDAGTAQQCFDPEPIVGCSDPRCERCQVYANADPICRTDGQCGWQCAPGYKPDPAGSGSCVADGGGGAGGSGGTGGGGGGGTTSTGGSGGTPTCTTSTMSQCPMCNPLGPFKCCKLDHTCGCTWAPTAVCY